MKRRTSKQVRQSKSKWSEIKPIAKAGGHLILLGPKKLPLRKWKDTPASKKDCKDHLYLYSTRRIGLVPQSVGLVAIDVDRHREGPKLKPKRVLRALTAKLDLKQAPPWNWTPSGGMHVWLEAKGWEVSNYQWELETAGGPALFGDVRGSKGYVVLWDPPQCVKALRRAPVLRKDRFDVLPPQMNTVDRIKMRRADKIPEDAVMEVGHRNSLLFKLCCRAGEAENRQLFEKAKESARKAPCAKKDRMSEHEIQSTAQSGWDRGLKDRLLAEQEAEADEEYLRDLLAEGKRKWKRP